MQEEVKCEMLKLYKFHTLQYKSALYSLKQQDSAYITLNQVPTISSLLRMFKYGMSTDAILQSYNMFL